MKLTELRPMLWTNKFEETIEFYMHVLSFTCVERNDEWGWATLQRDGVEIMLAKPDDQTPFGKPAFTGSFYIRTDNVDEAWELLKDKASICYPIESFEWNMREFAIYDNNGYILQFGQETA